MNPVFDSNKDTYTIDNIPDFLGYVDIKESTESTLVYRGLRSADMTLTPTLFRPFERGKASDEEFLKCIQRLQDNPTHEEDLLEIFEKRATPFLSSIPKNKLEWVALARHHGLPTRLLDWTESPLVALFFALEECRCRKCLCEKENSHASVVWVLETRSFDVDDSRTLKDLDQAINQQPYHIYFPYHISPRISAQQGCFTVHSMFGSYGFTCMEDDLASNAFSRLQIRKLVIPAQAKRKLREDLYKMGIHHFNLFPDLDGLCTQLDREFKTTFNQNSGD